MQVQVTGKHVDVGEALRTRVSDEISSSIGKYFDRGGGAADVVVSREGHSFKVDCAVTLASGQELLLCSYVVFIPSATELTEPNFLDPKAPKTSSKCYHLK